jgi:Bacterial Ig-like domain (group 3)
MVSSCRKQANRSFSLQIGSQVQVRCLTSRRLRLLMVAGLGTALALPALAVPVANSTASGASAAQNPRALSTQTTLQIDARDVAGQTHATFSVSVLTTDGLPATGAVVFSDHGKAIAGAALNAKGSATATLTLPQGDHLLTAAYQGDSTHLASISQSAPINAVTSGTPDFSVSVNPGSLSLTAGQSGSVVVSITPSDASALASPMFVELSCSGLPDQTACTFTPQTVQILPNATDAVTADLVVATQAASTAQGAVRIPSRKNPVAWAVMLPGVFGLGGLAFGARRRRWLLRLALFGLVGFIAVLGTTACSPLYYYYNHGPPQNLPTPAGSYNITIAAQSSNGITAITHTTTLALTVK